MKTLQELFNSLNGQERKLIIGILPPHNTIDDLLSISEDEFRQKLRNSLSPNELCSLSDVEQEFRYELMDRAIRVWLSSKEGPTTEQDEGEKEELRNNGKGKTKGKHVFPTYKYSQLGKGDLYESIILGGVPVFLRHDQRNNKLIPYRDIEEETRILRPPSIEEYSYTPYEFANIEELDHYVEYAKKQTIDSLYKVALDFIKKYNDQDECKQILLAVDAVWSYFQDRFGTTHYLGIVGDNDSGKSSIGNTFEAFAYRAVNMTSPTAANVFRALGMIEAGQCTLILDESDRISEDVDILNILKTGYDYKKKCTKNQ